MGPIRIAPPAVEPVTLTEAKEYLRVRHDFENGLILRLIARARETYEERTQRQLITATWRLTLDAFPGACGHSQQEWSDGDFIFSPRSPLQSASITYVDTNGATQTLATTVFTVDTSDVRGRIGLSYGQSWPSTRATAGAVVVTCVCGYGTSPSDVPQYIKGELEDQIQWLFARGVDSMGNDRKSAVAPGFAEFGALY